MQRKTVIFFYISMLIIGMVVGHFASTSYKRFPTTTEKVAFGGVERLAFVTSNITFNDVMLVDIWGETFKHDVNLTPGEFGIIEVKLNPDEDAHGTLLTVVPSTYARIFGCFLGCDALHVTIWATNKAEKEAWSAWARRAEVKYFTHKRKREKPTPPQHLMPQEGIVVAQ